WNPPRSGGPGSVRNVARAVNQQGRVTGRHAVRVIRVLPLPPPRSPRLPTFAGTVHFASGGSTRLVFSRPAGHPARAFLRWERPLPVQWRKAGRSCATLGET